MPEYLSPLITEKTKIESESTKRKKKFIEKSITGKTKVILEEKANIAAKEDWYVLRKNTNSYRMAKTKPSAEQLEDELWSIMAGMGFDELSEGRGFTVDVGDAVSPRQIDVFAKDSETALFIECTCCETPKKKKMANLIEKISSIHPKAAHSVNSHYGKSPKLKIRWIIATRNIEWGEADLNKAEEEKIIVLRDHEIDYYNKLTAHLKKGAKYQFLAHLFSNEKISGLEITVPATRGKMGGVAFYNFLIKPSDLMKIAYIGHKASRDIENLETYQRMLSPSRLKNIAQYIDNGGQFPTNIVINLKTKTKLRFDKKEKIGESAFGILYLPDNYASAWVIDGQHRLYGFAHSNRIKSDETTTLPVLAYENLPPMKEAELFVDINCEQVKVAKSLLIEIYSNLGWDAPEYEDRMDALRSRVVMAIDQRKTSPIYGRIKTTDKDKSNFRCLTLTSFNEGLKENKFFGEKKGTDIVPGPLTNKSSSDLEKSLKKAVDVLSGYLSFFSEKMPDHWELGDAKNGYLCTNNGIRALLRVLKEIFNHVEKVEHVETYLSNSDDLLLLIGKYIQPVLEFFSTARHEDINMFRSRQALQGVRQNSLMMMSLIHTEFNNFLPQGLEEYLETIDEEGTKESQSLIDGIQDRLFNVTINLLKNNFNEAPDQWWYEGIPDPVRNACVVRQDKEKGAKNKEQYICLIDYKSIAFSNWELFKKYFSFTKDGGKEKQLSWIVNLNSVRNITHHKEKWPATKDQVSFVREIHKNVMEKCNYP